ncbi:MAG TPA: glycosyltransferase, partial [Methylomirabilota bacterium]|nr:glycosyltransferase [Methylomirabilota bacterium]
MSGKFFSAGAEKIFLTGVTYGPFAPSEGTPFPDKPVVEADLDGVLELGANTLRTFHVPPPWLLDLAGARGLRVLVGVPWTQHVCFLDSPRIVADVRRAVDAGVRACREHPAVLGYLVGNEVPPDVVRWHGRARIARFLRTLVDQTRQVDPSALVAYANFPTTDYLETDFTDFLAFNVYLHREADFRRYLARLHSRAPDRPVVLTELGVDALREGREGQARLVSSLVHAAFAAGVAGTFVFSWTDEWFTGGEAVEDWAFGLVDRKRRPKPVFEAVRHRYATLPPPPPRRPLVSVVVCAYNEEATLGACLAGLAEQRYPHHEVIVVNDGSGDRTLEIAQAAPGVRVISQDNRGLSAARNAGIEAARGEIVAFTDADCVPDPDWLTYLVTAFETSGHAVVGGPNLPPPEDALVPSCVAVAPGGPNHVLLTDEVAEHVPGCNMAFTKKAMQEMNGFEPIFA